MKNKTISLLSGGLDSTVATALARQRYDVTLALTFDYGQRAASKEIEAARKLCEAWKIEHEVIDLPWLAAETHTALVDKNVPLPQTSAETLDTDAKSRAENVWVPNRNALFVSIAASFAEARKITKIVAGFNAEEAKTFPDNSKDFLDAANKLLMHSTKSDVSLVSPTIDMDKRDIASAYAELDIPFDNLWCCYRGEENLCGMCESCVRTIRAFKTAGLWDLIEGRF